MPSLSTAQCDMCVPQHVCACVRHLCVQVALTRVQWQHNYMACAAISEPLTTASECPDRDCLSSLNCLVPVSSQLKPAAAGCLLSLVCRMDSSFMWWGQIRCVVACFSCWLCCQGDDARLPLPPGLIRAQGPTSSPLQTPRTPLLQRQNAMQP